ncbi:uncharacterized protein [Amphiura filiformis]|uniref:uncharacterized protein n=1 Tax=Amphiura filiformis TaxID=82378 RepID=UPI003B2128E3
MADDLSSYDIFWSKDEQENDILNDNLHKNNSNRKILGRMEGNSQNETKSKLHDDRHQIPEKDVNPPQRKMKKQRHADKQLKMKEKPSLKDLRPEDKKRVANLIRELAKAGEEKEVAVEQLQVERLEFEHRMKSLHHQVDDISQEREIVQKQYLQCQKLLADYQKQLAEEQDKVNQMNRIIKSTPKKHCSKQHTSPLPQGVLHEGSAVTTLHRSPPSYTQPSHQPASRVHHLDSYHDHHQPSLNGYPPPHGNSQAMNGNHGNQHHPQMNGYQPLLFHNQSKGEAQMPRNHNGVTGQNHQLDSLHQHTGSQITDHANSDFEFEPPMSSTHRPSSHQHHAKSRQRHREHVSRLYAMHNQDARVPSSQPASSSPEFLLSGHSRTNSGEFQPLLPEPDNDSETTSPPPPPSPGCK